MHTIRNVYFKVFFMLKSRFKNMITKHKGTNNYLYNKNVFNFFQWNEEGTIYFLSRTNFTEIS
jgi:hypothetical protein